MTNESVQLDHRIIAGIIEPHAKVLDLGCGNGELLAHLVKEKDARVQGIELNEQSIFKCVEKGLSVFHSDIDSGLTGYPDRTFDYVILNQTMQQIKNVNYVIDEALRVGSKVIVGFPNFAHIHVRFEILFSGRVPVTKSLPYEWHDTPNLRFLSITDFIHFCHEKQYRILKSFCLGKKGEVRLLPNLFARNAVFVITR
jgi:methionine biosynthesis protein MetW